MCERVRVRERVRERERERRGNNGGAQGLTPTHLVTPHAIHAGSSSGGGAGL